MRRLRVLPLLLVLPAILAGCATPEALDPQVETPRLDDLLPAPLNAVIDPAGGLGEPSLGITPDGVLFTTGDAGRGMGVYRSMDNGTTWENLGDPTAPFPNFDPDLAVDADGTVWADVLYLGCNAVAVSRDQGATWSMNPVVCNGPVGDRQYVIPTKGGTAYLYYHQIPSFHQTAMKTTDYGRTWLPTGPMEALDHHLLVNGGSGWGGGGFWNPKTDSVYATFTWFEGGLATGSEKALPGYTVTKDGGKTWKTGTVTKEAWGRNLGLGLVVGAADEAGNVYIAWAEAKDKDVAVFLAVSRDDGETWSEPLRVDRSEGSKVFPAITAGPAGKVAVAYYEADKAGYPSSVTKDTAWNVTVAYTVDALAENATFQHAPLSASTVRMGPICPDGAGCTSDRQFLDYFALKRTQDGRLASVFTSTEAVPGKTVNVFGVTQAPVLA